MVFSSALSVRIPILCLISSISFVTVIFLSLSSQLPSWVTSASVVCLLVSFLLHLWASGNTHVHTHSHLYTRTQEHAREHTHMHTRWWSG